ncbi:MAG: addiction module protein [bacterium]
MNGELKQQIQKLSVSERILLAEDIWDSVAQENQSFDLTPSQKEALEKRSMDFTNNPEIGRKWEHIKAEFLGK